MPRLFGLRLGMLLHLYGRRLRAHPVAELLAGLGVAVGVALVFGVLLANASLTGSAAKLVKGLAGGARFELAASSSQGFDQRIVARVGRLQGVEVAAAVLRRNVTITGPDGAREVQLIGVSASLEDLGGIATRELAAGAQLLHGGIGLPGQVAQSIGAKRRSVISLAAGAQVRRVHVRALLGGSLAALDTSPVVVAVLHVAQSLTSSPHTVSQVLVKPLPGKADLVRRELRAIAGEGLQVRPATAELKLLEVATAPNRQSTSLFTAIAVMIGFLLALNAMLMTVPERRRFIAELRMQGYDSRQVALLLGFQAAVLGAVASLLGIGLGALLAHALFQQVPDFLTAAFPIGTEEALQPLTLIAAVLCGMLAAAGASLASMIDLSQRRSLESSLAHGGARSEVIASRTSALHGGFGLALVVLALLLALLAPSLTIVSGVALGIAVICLSPLALRSVVALLPRIAVGVRSPSLIVAVSELRAVTVRAVALTGIVALAVYGGVAIGGARQDLLKGISQATTQYFSTAPVWVTAGRDVFNTGSFDASGPARAAARARGVSSVRIYRGGLVDVGNRRMWLRARPPSDGILLERSQLVEGDIAIATKRIRAGGWAAVSSGFASEEGLHVGGAFTLPTPAGPRSLRIAAILTNSGWPPGTITIDASEYERSWGSSQAAALEVSLDKGISPARGRASVRSALVSSYLGLAVNTASQRAALSNQSALEGLRTLQEISIVLLIAAALAVASALSAAIWQRRTRLGALKIQGYSAAQLWGAVLIESAVTILAGSVLGAVVGVGGHALASRYLALTTGFPAPFAPGPVQALLTVALFVLIALAVIAVPGGVAARVQARTVLQD